MSTTFAITPEIDAAIRRRPELLAAVNSATEFFESRYSAGPPTRTPSAVTFRWAWDSVAGKEFVKPRVEEREENGDHRLASVAIPVIHMNDPVNRELWMSRLWIDLLSERSAENIQRIQQLMLERESEDNDGEENADGTRR